MDRRHWQDGPLSLTNGNLVTRTIFTKEENADSEGAVLRYIDRYARGFLEGGVSTVPQTNEGVQEVFFVADGFGLFVAAGEERRIGEGDGILVPPGVEYGFVNDGDDPMEFLIVSEAASDDRSSKLPIVRNYRERPLLVSHWSYLVHPIFGQNDGLIELRDILVVLIDPLQTGDNHGHGPNMDEVWTMWKGQAVHVVGQEVCVQTLGTAISVCPSELGHTLINHTEEPCYLFYFCSIDRNN